MMRRLMPFALAALAGCAYYNGIYNAKAAARTGDHDRLRGEGSAAAEAYLRSAATAETVLVRHPKSRWRPDALYLAARGYAFGDNCVNAARRFPEYFALTNRPADERDRATIAYASCLSGTPTELLQADTLLRPLLASRNADIRGQAALWAGKVAMQLGDADRAEQLLAQVSGGAAAWEFMAAAFQTGNLARGESLLVARAQVGDWRSEVGRRIDALWYGGRRAGAVRIADLYGSSRASAADRVALRFRMSDLAAAAGDTALARREAIEAQRLALSPAVDALARVRLLALRIREFDALADVDAAVMRDTAHVHGTAQFLRIRDNLAIVHLLMGNPDPYGANVFLAAEIMRDSLGALRLAHAMFRSIERDFGDYEIAARALLAARAIVPESTKVYDARILQKWDSSSAAFVLRGLDPSMSKQAGEDGALTRAWRFVMLQWADTLKARKTTDSLAALATVRRE